MRKLLYIILLIAYSCNSGSPTEQIDSTDLNELKIKPELIADISMLSKKSLEKNSVIRYKPSDSSNVIFEPYDSLVPGIKLKFVSEQLSYKIIDKYFDIVKSSGNYLYLTNLDFDDSYNSYYDIVVAPISDQFELIRFVGTEPVNYDLTVDDVVAWFRNKQTEFDFQIIVADLDRIEAIIKTEPKSYIELGNEIYKFCPDVIDQGHSDMEELVEYLKSQKHMWFWWD